MKSIRYFRLLVLLGCFFSATIAPAQTNKIFSLTLRQTAQNLRSAVERVIGRKTSPFFQENISPIIFAPGQTLPALSAKDNFSIDPYPLPQRSIEMYRGMRLDVKGEQLRNILKNGLEVAKTNAYLRESYNGKKYPEGTKAIFATDWIGEATFFAQPNQDDPTLSVLVHLKRVGNSSFIQQVPHDIPTSWIYRVSAWLLVDGEARWGEIKLDAEDNLIFTPYPKPGIKP